jgi:hypothetical protein
LLSVVGIRPASGSIGPDGIHLRWAFSAELGFPSGPFRLFRREALAKPIVTWKLDQVAPNTPVGDGAVLDGIRLRFPVGGGLVGTGIDGLRASPRAPGLRVELRFAKPVARVSLRLANPGALVVRAFAGERLVLQTAVAAATGEVSADLEWPGITVVELPLDFDRLSRLAFSTVAQVCRGDDVAWDPPRVALTPVAQESEVAPRFEPGLHNRYVASPQDAVARYGAGAPALIDWLASLRAPASPPFVDAGVPPHRLELAGDPRSPVPRLRPLPLLLAAATDPNIARLLGLYWVDRDDAVGGPQLDRAYDYKAEADWNGETQCGLALRIGAQAAERPVVRGPVTARQGRGFDWAGRVPRARVAVRWRRPPAIVSATPVQAVLYDVARINGTSLRPLTADTPVMVPTASFGQRDAWMFRERNVALGRVRYSVSAIDLFGQTGPGVESSDLELVDREAPPPPVRVRAELAPGGRAATIEFEYGYLQRQQAPDTSSARCYARRDSLLETRPVAAAAVDVLADGERRWRHLLRVSDPLGAPLPAAALQDGGRLLYQALRITHDAGGRRALHRRRRLVIDAVRADGHVEIVSSEPQVHGGHGELVSDPKAPHLWQRLSPEVQLREPVRATYERQTPSLTARIVAVRDLPERTSPLTQLPPERRPPDAYAPAVRELALDVALLDADIFRDGTVEIAGHSATVLSQPAGGFAGQGHASVAVPATVAAVPGQTVQLRPSSSLARRYVTVELEGDWPAALPRDRGGEIAFLMKDAAGPLGARLGRVASAVTATAGRLSMLVDANETVWDELLAGIACELSCPYHVAVALDSIDLTPEPGKASRSLFLAVTAEDDRANESSLSSPALVVAVRPAPHGVPGTPHACSGTSADAEGFASRPDGRGNATLCLTWEAGGLTPLDGLTWEVARALDATICAVHRREWSAGRVDAAAPVGQGPIISGALSQIVDAGNGLLRARFATIGPAPGLALVKGARLQQATRYWTVTSASATGAGAVDVLLRPAGPGDPAPAAGTVSLEGVPDYTAALGDDAALRGLAASLPDAFAIVTGAPIPAREYRDVLPGTGRNRFFYRVRAVDAAQQRSVWSPVSPPMRLVDTTAPATPTITQAVGGERRATLRWPRDPDARVERYRIHRARSQEDLAAPFGLPVSAEALAGTGAEVTWVDEPLEGTLGDERFFYRVTAVKRVRHGSGAADVFEIASLPSDVVALQVLDTSRPPPVVPVVAGWDQTAGEPPSIRLEWQSGDVAFVVERNYSSGVLWQRLDLPVASTGAGWGARDTTADTARSYGYRITAVNRFGRESVERPVVRVEPLQREL